jgi:hypothetical protein
MTSLELYFKFFTIANDIFSKINCFRFLYNSDLEENRKKHCCENLLNFTLNNRNNLTYRDLSNLTDLFLNIPETETIARTILLPHLRNRQNVYEDFKGSSDNKFFNIYSDAQNVHTSKISHCVNKRILTLYEDKNKDEIDSVEISNVITKYLQDEKLCTKKIENSLKRVSVDLAIFTDKKVRLRTILVKIWHRILNMELEYKKEAVNRLCEELTEMNGTCSTGHASRLVNILSEIKGGFSSLKISWQDQIKSNIQTRTNNKIKNAENSEDILVSMISDNKTTYNEFLKENKESLFNELLEEFKPLFDKENEELETLTQVSFTEFFDFFYNSL